ncbi:MAG: DNA alkylation repair protein [Pseudomonadota bacterium]|nr:DNA alkylation repair protein [Pseudomonadota bacterium]
MSKLLKDEIDPESIKKLALLIKNRYPDFNVIEFEASVFNQNWAGLGLKQRIRQLSIGLKNGLDTDYPQSLKVLESVSVEFSGLFHFVFADYVECFGLKFYDESIEALTLFTENSTAEFAIRIFLESQPEKTKTQMVKWSVSENEHLRRLASEGVRPKLPWAKHLPWIADRPDWIKPIIENLKSDDSLYVRKSVANLLNDLSKSQAVWMMDLCESWKQDQQASPETLWIIKHALRTLLKQGNPRALSLIGYGDIEHIILENWHSDQAVAIGKKLNWSFNLSSKSQLGLLRLEYAISFLRKRQHPYRKVFKIAESEYQESNKEFTKQHNFKVISTRKYVVGQHKLELIVNGKVIQTCSFELIE